jgi:CheY-like chemotaxis protein
VLSAADGDEAVRAVEGGAAFDLLLTDVVLPGGMNGRRVAERISELLPGVKVLFMSGYTENAVVHQGRLDADVQLLNKPFRRQDLARKLRSVFAAD